MTTAKKSGVRLTAALRRAKMNDTMDEKDIVDATVNKLGISFEE